VGAGAVLADAYYQVYRISDSLDDITGRLSVARNSLSRGKLPPGDPFMEAVQLANEAEAQVGDARFTFEFVGRVPFVRRPVDIARHQVTAASEWAASATIARDMVVELLGAQSGGVEDLQALEKSENSTPLLTDGVVNVKLVASLTPRLEGLIQHLEAADHAIRTMPDIPFPPRLADAKERALGESSEGLQAARDALSGLRLLPSFLGTQEPKTYFVGLQNLSDQRGTGGALLAYAIIRIDNGKIELDQAGPIHEIDDADHGVRGVPLPPAVAWYVNNARVNPRLANGAGYSPNFPVVAATWAAMVEKTTGKRIDGVIALDPAAISYSLGNNTKIRLRSYPEEITGENALAVIANDQYRLDKDLQRVFAGELIGAAWPKLSDPRPFVRKVQQLGVGLKEKHLQIWSRDPEQQDLIEKLNWDGGLEAGPGDYLFLAHNKRNGNKVDYYLKQNITYNVTVLNSGAVQSEYRLVLTGDVPPDEPPQLVGRHDLYGLNLAMENLYVPKRATFESVEPQGEIPYDISPAGFVQHEEGNFRVFTKTIPVADGNPATIVYRYDVPDVIQTTEDGTSLYRLTIQHQSMVNPAEITVNVTFPKGTELTPPAGWTVKGRVATFKATLTTDLVAEIAF
jgi:hypothetical protein